MITFKTAKLLQSINCDLPSFMGYDVKGNLSLKTDETIPAYTWEQVFNWLLMKYGIYVVIYLDTDWTSWNYKIETKIPPSKIMSFLHDKVDKKEVMELAIEKIIKDI